MHEKLGKEVPEFKEKGEGEEYDGRSLWEKLQEHKVAHSILRGSYDSLRTWCGRTRSRKHSTNRLNSVSRALSAASRTL